jgi:hypothetical protein
MSRKSKRREDIGLGISEEASKGRGQSEKEER